MNSCTRHRPARAIALVALLHALSGCACQLSGTPLDTVEKTWNPTCWFK